MSILSFEEPYTDNEVVGYYEDKLIVKREDGELFFCEIPENLIEIGETISAIANGACIHNQKYGYLVFGIEDETQKIIGTTFKAKIHKKGNEDLEHWLLTRLNPKIDFEIFEFNYDENRKICVFIIPATVNQPVEFLHKSYVRINSITRKLSEFPQKQAKIWKKEIVALIAYLQALGQKGKAQ